jgi:hypothetical protein
MLLSYAVAAAIFLLVAHPMLALSFIADDAGWLFFVLGLAIVGTILYHVIHGIIAVHFSIDDVTLLHCLVTLHVCIFASIFIESWEEQFNGK